MNTMNTIEKIRAEIERLKGQLIRGACAAQIEMETNCKEEAYDEVLSFLSTLESEKPMNQDELEKELDRFLHGEFQRTAGGDFNNYLQVARHFAQWGAEHMKNNDEKLVPKDLEEASSKFATYTAPNGVSIEFLEKKLSFQAGAKWQKEQDDKYVDTIYQQGIEKGKDEMRDALLEWAEKKIAKGMIDEWDKGYVQCLKDLIDKLNNFLPLID